MGHYYRENILMLVAGGTGGHIHPSLSLINKMRNNSFLLLLSIKRIMKILTKKV